MSDLGENPTLRDAIENLVAAALCNYDETHAHRWYTLSTDEIAVVLAPVVRDAARVVPSPQPGKATHARREDNQHPPGTFARVEVGPSPEQIDAAAYVLFNQDSDRHWDDPTPPWSSFYWSELSEDERAPYRAKARRVLVAACSVRGR